MQIRRAKEEDYQACAELHERVVPGRDRETFFRQRMRRKRMYVVIEDDRIIGLITFETNFIGCLYISLLIVDPAYRRRGIARALVEQVATHSTDGRLFSSTEEDNAISVKMHEALGFVRSGYVENLPQPTREIIYFKNLSAG